MCKIVQELLNVILPLVQKSELPNLTDYLNDRTRESRKITKSFNNPNRINLVISLTICLYCTLANKILVTVKLKSQIKVRTVLNLNLGLRKR